MTVEAGGVVISRMRLLSSSAINTLPLGRTDTADGLARKAEVAGPPSPPTLGGPGAPAIVAIVPAGETWRITSLSVSAIRKPPPARATAWSGSFSCAVVAGPPSPLNPGCPGVPATVVNVPDGETCETSSTASAPRSAIR